MAPLSLLLLTLKTRQNIDHLHEGFLEGQELAELDRRAEDGEGDDVVVVGIDGEGRVERDVLVTSEKYKQFSMLWSITQF